MDKKKPELRVLHISSAMTWRGGEQQISYLVGELRQRGIAQWVLCAHGSKLMEWCEGSGVDFFSYRKISAINPFAAWRIRRVCKQVGANVLHTHDSHAHTYAVMAAAFFGNKAALAVHRRVDFPIGGNWLSRWKYNHPSVSAIICTSKAILDILKPAIKSPEKLTVVHSGVDFARFGLDENAARMSAMPPSNFLKQEFGLPPDCFAIVNVAAIAPHKDYFTFVKTAERLLRENLPAKFFIIGGDGGEETSIRNFIKEKKLEGHFYLLGHRGDVPMLLPGADVLLFTSKTEGIGGATFEAFACGVPVVATAAGGVPEVVEHEVSGLLAPVGDAQKLAASVMRVLLEPGLKEKLVKNASLKLLHFSKKKTAEEIVNCYHRLL